MTSKRIVAVIEDDTVLRLQAAELFELGGMEVETFASGDEAIAFVRNHRADVACIFTDLKLGNGADGMDVVRYVSNALPDVTVVLTSGQVPERPAHLPPNVRFLSKPWAPSDVMNTIRDADGRSSVAET
jgi:two-component system, response regulator PdtaR